MDTKWVIRDGDAFTNKEIAEQARKACVSKTQLENRMRLVSSMSVCARVHNGLCVCVFDSIPLDLRMQHTAVENSLTVFVLFYKTNLNILKNKIMVHHTPHLNSSSSAI